MASPRLDIEPANERAGTWERDGHRTPQVGAWLAGTEATLIRAAMVYPFAAGGTVDRSGRASPIHDWMPVGRGVAS